MSALASAEPDRGTERAEAAATQRLYERYAGPIFGFCLKRLGSREEAEDAVQTTFLNAQRGLRRGVVPEFEAAWLYKIAANVCNTRHDRARRRPEAVRDLDALQDVLAAPERSEPDVIAALPGAIARMPATQRRALLLREWQGLSYREIAADLEITEAAVETLLYRARRSLMANLERPERRGRLSRVDLGSIVAFLKSILSGGGVAKLVIAGVAVTAAVTSLGSSTPSRRTAPSHQAQRGVLPTATVGHSSKSTLAGPTASARATPSHRARANATASGSPGSARGDAAAPSRGHGKPSAPQTQADSTAPSSPAPGATKTNPPPQTTTLPISTPSLPVATPTLPVTTPSLPVTTPSLPVPTPSLPASTPSLPVLPPQLPPVPVPTPPLPSALPSP